MLLLHLSTRQRKKQHLQRNKINLFTEMIIVFPKMPNQYPAAKTRCCKERCGEKEREKRSRNVELMDNQGRKLLRIPKILRGLSRTHCLICLHCIESYKTEQTCEKDGCIDINLQTSLFPSGPPPACCDSSREDRIQYAKRGAVL